jgi:GR25 family glycosyltransferase involved in LPS biosynthesis
MVINLDDRIDRWKHSEKEATKSLLPPIRVRAIEASSVLSQFTSAPVAACWFSHKEAISEFLKTDSLYALILEDDFEFKCRVIDQVIGHAAESNLDFIQLGFLRTTFKESLKIRIENFYDLLIRIYGIFEKLSLKSDMSKKLLVRERKGLSWRYVMYDIRPGAHGYILNRNAAQYILSLNDPVFLSTDDLYKSLGNMRYIRMARLRKSLIRQKEFTSSINPR